MSSNPKGRNAQIGGQDGMTLAGIAMSLTGWNGAGAEEKGGKFWRKARDTMKMSSSLDLTSNIAMMRHVCCILVLDWKLGPRVLVGIKVGASRRIGALSVQAHPWRRSIAAGVQVCGRPKSLGLQTVVEVVEVMVVVVD